MTSRLHLGDPYRTRFQALVGGVGRDELIVDQTCFFGPHPLLPSDTGWIDGHRIAGIRRGEGGRLAHVLAEPGSGGLPVAGRRVEGEIDWGPRERVMRLHTAQHLLATAAATTNDIEACRLGPVGPDAAKLVIEADDERLGMAAIAQWFRAAVRDDLSCAVTTSSTPPFTRMWHLDGFGSRACDGVHCRSTGEVGSVVLTASARGPRRIELGIRLAGVGAGHDECRRFITTAASTDDHHVGRDHRQVP